jgi:hypothetical protein
LTSTAGRGPRLALLLLVLGLPPLVAQLVAPVPRLDSDAVEYFSYVRSLYYDHDLDFANEFQHFGILTRGDKVRPTATGHRRTVFSVGPALLWMPFYAGGDLLARLSGDTADGYSGAHIRAVGVASWFYGLVGLLLVFVVLEDLVPPSVAFWTVFLLLYATFLYWYMVHEAATSHAVSFFMAAVVLSVWWPARRALTPRRAVVLGLLIGLSASVRWQNAVLLLLPAITLLPFLRGSLGPTLRAGLLALVAFSLGAFPQMLAWKAIFGSYLLADPPHGRDFLRLDHPYLLNTFFSSRHGLLYWTPVLWGGFLGLLALWRRDRFTTGALLLPLGIMSYVNACSGDWWAGGSFSNRRFDSVLPFLAIGLALGLAAVLERVRRSPGSVLVAAGLGLVLSNLLLVEQYRRAQHKLGVIPRDDTVSFARVTEQSARIISEAVGTPLAWPANWVFAHQQDLPAFKYDLMVGKYLFYRQNNLGGIIDLGDPRVDPGLIAGDWTSPAPCGAETCRAIRGRARVFAPLDVAQTLDVTVRAEGAGTLTVAVNGSRVGEFPLGAALTLLRTRVPAASWHREMNEVTLTVSDGGQARVDRLLFAPAEGTAPGRMP